MSVTFQTFLAENFLWCVSCCSRHHCSPQQPTLMLSFVPGAPEELAVDVSYTPDFCENFL